MNLLLYKHTHVIPTLLMLFELHTSFKAPQAHRKGKIIAKVDMEKDVAFSASVEGLLQYFLMKLLYL